MALMPRLNALRPQLDGSAFDRGDLDARAGQYRDATDMASEDAAMADGGGASLLQTRTNNLKARAMAGNNPEWDAFSQSLRDAGGGRGVRLVGGASPEGSNQITGLNSQRSPGANMAVQDGPYGAPSDSINSLHQSINPMPETHDVWRAKTRQRIYGA